MSHQLTTDIIAMGFYDIPMLWMQVISYLHRSPIRSFNLRFPGCQGARGSRSYMAPEMLAGEGYAFPADMWPSCGLWGEREVVLTGNPHLIKQAESVDFKQLHSLKLT